MTPAYSKVPRSLLVSVTDLWRRFGLNPPTFRQIAELVRLAGFDRVCSAVEFLGGKSTLTVERLEALLREWSYRDRIADRALRRSAEGRRTRREDLCK